MDGQLIYSFVSLATTRNTPDGAVVPIEGMKLMAALAHRYGVPVTWIVDSNSAQESQAVLTQGHKECGDDVILQIDISRIFAESGFTPESKAEEIVILRQRLPELIASQREKIKKALPWTDASVIAADVRSDALVEILEELGCTGLWGHRWRETEEDATESGCPWGFFYASGQRHDAPAQSGGGMVAVESTSLDLNSVFHTGNPHIFSADPHALRKSGLCLDEGLNYPRALLDEYLQNCGWNRFVSFIQQQPAYEMIYANYHEYDSGTISEIANILEGFFQAAKSNPNIQPLSISQAIQLYKREFEYTENHYMIFDGIVPPHIEVNYYIPPEPKQKPPYPFTFFYYDRECQLIFKEGQMTPVEMRNYFRPPFESKHYLEKETPSISNFRPSRDRDKLILEFEIDSVKQMPFGLTIWDDHSMFSLVSTNARLVKWIGDYLLFIRIDLEEGLNRIEVSLSI